MTDPTPEAKQITVRCLPDGQPQPGEAAGWEGRRMRVDLLSGAASADLLPGALVEIEAPERLYLGEVETSQGPSLTVLIEHCLQRQALAKIREVWR